jgi:hypothetical protein
VAIVGDGGIDAARTVAIRTGTNHNATWNSFELFVNGSAGIGAAGLNSIGDSRLEELRAVDELSFGVIQVPSTLYGLHYVLGDTVTAYYRGFTFTPKIFRVAVDVRQRGNQNPEQIDVMVSNA